jgi:hypothetical protein
VKLHRVRADGEAVALRIAPFVGQMADKVYRPKGEPRVLRVNILWRGGAAAPCGRELTLDRIAPADWLQSRVPGRCSRSAREPFWCITCTAYERRPPAVSAAIRNAAATNERLSFGMTAFFLNRWISAVSVSLSRATLM